MSKPLKKKKIKKNYQIKRGKYDNAVQNEVIDYKNWQTLT